MCHGDQGQGKPPMAPKIAGSAKVVGRPHQGRRSQGSARQADEHGHRRPGHRAGSLCQGAEVVIAAANADTARARALPRAVLMLMVVGLQQTTRRQRFCRLGAAGAAVRRDES